MQGRLKILFTNNTLGKPAGTELSVHDYCLAMQERGHGTAAFSSQLGEIAGRLAKAGVHVTDDLETLPWTPEIIHGHHEWETSLAALRWPNTPLISFCRGTVPWQEAPCRAPWTHRYVAVDQPCRLRLLQREGIPEAKIEVILNGVDLSRFPRRSGLPAKPRKVLVFSNYANETNYLRVIREVCATSGLECVAIGAGVGNVTSRPEDVLRDFDLVFAKGKAALEALASGCAVVVADVEGLGPLVDPGNFAALREESFGYPCMTGEWTTGNVTEVMRRWDPDASGKVAEQTRACCGISNVVDSLERLYREALESKPDPTGAEVGAFAAGFLTPQSLAYKLGREIQIAWRKDRASEIPREPEERSVEFDRMLNSFRKGLASVRDLKEVRRLAEKGGGEDSGSRSRSRSWSAWRRKPKERTS